MKRQEQAALPTKFGDFEIIAYADDAEERMPHLALVSRGFQPESQVAYVRIHSECMTGDLFGSRRCDCGEQLISALTCISEKGGILIYLRQEGRGIGIINKLKAYNLQDQGLDTVNANTHLGFEPDARSYEIAVEILKDLGARSIYLLTNNPDKLFAIEGSGIELKGRIPLEIAPVKENESYLRAKKDLMGHLLEF